jgi:hypothetical protein
VEFRGLKAADGARGWIMMAGLNGITGCGNSCDSRGYGEMMHEMVVGEISTVMAFLWNGYSK